MKQKHLIIWMIILIPLLFLLIMATDDVFGVVFTNFKRYLFFIGGCVLMFVID